MLQPDVFASKNSWRYKDTGESYRGTVRRVKLSDDVYFYTADGREVVPALFKDPKPLTAEELFYNNSWKKE